MVDSSSKNVKNQTKATKVNNRLSKGKKIVEKVTLIESGKEPIQRFSL